MRKILFFGVLCLLTGITASGQTEIATVRNNLLNHRAFSSRYTTPPASPAMADLLASVQSNGSFNGATVTPGHLSVNIYKLVYELKRADSGYFNDPTVKDKVYKALNYWLSNFPAFKWTTSAMEQPTYLGMVLLKLYDDFEADKSSPEYSAMIANMRSRAKAFLRHSWSDGKSKSTFRTPNLGTLVTDDWRRMGNVGYRIFGYVGIVAALDNAADMDTLSMIVTNQFSLKINKPGAAAIAALYDGSLHQHGPQTFNIGYGRDWINDLSRYSGWVKGTPWALTTVQKEFWGEMVLNGMLWMYYKGRAPHNIVGRHSQLKGGLYGSALSFLSSFAEETGPDIRQYASAVYFRDKLQTDPTNYQIDSSKYLWNSHLILQHSPNYFASVKMLSNRVVGAESSDPGTGQGLMSFHIADGSTMIYRTGAEYDEARVGWNWRAIPGATIKQKTGPLPTVDWSTGYESDNVMAGGVSDGKVSIGAFDLDRRHSYHNTRAFKGYFTFPDLMLCLGNSIRDTETVAGDVHTTINQVERKTAIVYSLDGGPEQTIDSTQSANLASDITQPSWFWHDNIGYVIIPSEAAATNVILKAETRSGNWYTLDKRNTNATVSANIFQLGINHGGPTTGWRDNSYRYVVIPNVSKEQLAGFVADKVTARNAGSLYIDRNDAAVIAASYGDYTGVLFTGDQANITENLGFDSLRVTSDKAAALLFKRTAAGMELYASDMRNKFSVNPVTVTVNRLYGTQRFTPERADAPCTVAPAGTAQTTLQFSLSKTSEIFVGEPIHVTLRQTTTSTLNLALNKPASQSTTVFNGVASKAVDGNTNGVWSSGTITHTAENETTPSWWQVDLEAAAHIETIEIFNRTEACCKSRLSNYVVMLSDVPFEQAAATDITSFPQTATAGSPTTIAVGKAGRYLRIRLNAPATALSLAEVRVNGYWVITENLAFQKAASQSTTVYSGFAAKAVDGNTNGAWLSESITHTAENETTPSWWAVDLGRPAQIHYINVFNRTDACCSARLTNYLVQISRVPFELATSADITTFPQNEVAGSPTRIAVNGKGRYVRIQQAQANQSLSLAEVEVVGYFEGAPAARLASEFPSDTAQESVGGAPDFIISPNPAVDVIHIRTAHPMQPAVNDLKSGEPEEVLIVDNFGQVVKRIKPGRAGDVTLQIADLPAGIYVIRIFDGTRWHTRKLLTGK